MDDVNKNLLDENFKDTVKHNKNLITEEVAKDLSNEGLTVGQNNYNNELDARVANLMQERKIVELAEEKEYGEFGGKDEVERQHQEWLNEQDEPNANIQEQQEEEKKKKEQEQTYREEQVENIVEQGEMDREETTKENLRNEFSSINQGSPSIQNEISSPDALKQEIAEQEHEAAKSEIWEDFKKANKGIDRDDPER